MAKRLRRWHVAAALVAAALLLTVGVMVWRDPYELVRAEFARQRVWAGLKLGHATVDDHRWAFAFSDDAPAGAPTVVMVHGFTGSKENWFPVAARLRGRYRLVIPDLPGWGQSERR